MGDTGDADTVVGGPEESGQPDTPPQTETDPLEVAEEVAAELGATKEAGGETPSEEPEIVVEGAEETQITDPALDALRKVSGYENHEFKTAEDAFSSMGELRTRLSQRDELAALGQQVIPHLAEFQQWKADQVDATRREREASAWSPPELPDSVRQEGWKPEAERDPEVVRKFNDHARYVNDKWSGWTADPNSFVEEMVMPTVGRVVQQAIQDREYERGLKATLDADKEFVGANETEITKLIRGGAPVEMAVELVKLRHGEKPQVAEQAKADDLATLEGNRAGPSPSHAEPTNVGDVEVDLHDPAQVAVAEALRLGIPLD